MNLGSVIHPPHRNDSHHPNERSEKEYRPHLVLSTMRILLPPLLFVAFRLEPSRSFTRPSSGRHARSIPGSTRRLEASALEELSKLTILSIDSADIDIVKGFAEKGLITDATTNPLFVSQAGASGDKRYEDMVFDAVMYAKEKRGGGDSPLPDFEPELNIAMDKLASTWGPSFWSWFLERCRPK